MWARVLLSTRTSSDSLSRRSNSQMNVQSAVSAAVSIIGGGAGGGAAGAIGGGLGQFLGALGLDGGAQGAGPGAGAGGAAGGGAVKDGFEAPKAKGGCCCANGQEAGTPKPGAGPDPAKGGAGDAAK